MASEKLMILKMLEEGKITADEAARLMDASEGEQSSTSSQPLDTTPLNNPNHASEPIGGGSYSSYSSQHQNRSQNHSFENFASELGRKFDTLAKDMEPKLQKLTEVVVEKTATVADKISKSLTASQTPKPYDHAASQPQSSFSSGTEKQFEMSVNPGYNELSIAGLNGDVLINGYNGDKLTVNVNYRAKFVGANIELMKLGDKYYLNYEEEHFEHVSIDVFIPESLFKNIKIRTTNGKILLSTIITDYLIVENINGSTELRNITAENLQADSSNGIFNLYAVKGKNGKIESFNGNVAITSLDMENLKLSALNGSVNMNIDYYNLYNEYTWVLEASNGKFTMNIPSAPYLGYYVKAQTSLNNVKFGITGMNYLVNTPSSVEAKSINYDEVVKHVKLSVETSNAPLIIN